MKPLLILLLVFMLAGCGTRSNSNTAQAVCTTVVSCCKSVTACTQRQTSKPERPFSVAMHEIGKEILTW